MFQIKINVGGILLSWKKGSYDYYGHWTDSRPMIIFCAKVYKVSQNGRGECGEIKQLSTSTTIELILNARPLQW